LFRLSLFILLIGFTLFLSLFFFYKSQKLSLVNKKQSFLYFLVALLFIIFFLVLTVPFFIIWKSSLKM